MTDRSRVLVAIRVPASPDRAFTVFTEQIGAWWRHNGLFQFSAGRTGTLAFEPGSAGRLVETYADGDVYEIGRVTLWDPPSALALTWRQGSFAENQETELRVRFEAAGDQTRVIVEHFGWEAIPAEHAARHGFPLAVFERRCAEWWQAMLAGVAESV